jgi:hypothetical protein
MEVKAKMIMIEYDSLKKLCQRVSYSQKIGRDMDEDFCNFLEQAGLRQELVFLDVNLNLQGLK